MSTAPKTYISISTGSVVKIIAIILFVGALYYLRDVVFIILTAIVIASAIEPAARWLVKRKIPRIISVALIYAVLISILAFFFYLILPYFLTQLVSFINILPKQFTTLNVKSTGFGSEFFGWQNVLQGLSQSSSIADAVQNFALNITTASGSLLIALTAFFGGAISFVFIVVISFYFAVQDQGIADFLRLVTPLKKEEYAVSLWQRTQHKIARWIQGQFILALIVGILVFVGLSILRVKNALFLAFISGAFEIIPVFGPFIGSVPGVLVGFTQGGFSFGLIVALVYLVIQQIESNVIYPLVVQKVLDIPPLVVIIALVVGARVGGFLGILLSVPVAVAITEYMSDVGKKRILAREKISNNVE